MNSQALILRRTRHGWAIDLTGAGELARFRGPGAHARAMRYLTQIKKTQNVLAPPQKPRRFSPGAMC